MGREQAPADARARLLFVSAATAAALARARSPPPHPPAFMPLVTPKQPFDAIKRAFSDEPAAEEK
jgi:hypothetical protein